MAAVTHSKTSRCGCVLVFAAAIVASLCCQARSAAITVDTSRVIFTTDERYLSVTLDWGQITHKLEEFNLTNVVGRACAKALSPSYLRLGGTSGDFAWYDIGKDAGTQPYNSKGFPPPQFSVSPQNISALAQYAKDAGWEFIIGASAVQRTPNNTWNSSNFESLKDWVASEGIEIVGWELGNEPDLFPRHNITVEPDVLAEDFIVFSNLVRSGGSPSPLVIGPDIAFDTKFLQPFVQKLKSIGPTAVDRITFHHYYGNSKTYQLKQFIDPEVLDSLGKVLDEMNEAVRPSLPTTELWLGETSSTYGGGTANLSESFAAGFLWLDKLGMCATHNISVVARQDFAGGNYAIMTRDWQPTPDFFTSWLFKQFVGQRVLSVTVADSDSSSVRAYGFCGLEKGITMIVLNVQNTTANVVLAGTVGKLGEQQQYILQPFGGSLTANSVSLNGATSPLMVGPDGSLPSLSAKVSGDDSIDLPPYSYGFILFPDADAAACSSAE